MFEYEAWQTRSWLLALGGQHPPALSDLHITYDLAQSWRGVMKKTNNYELILIVLFTIFFTLLYFNHRDDSHLVGGD